MIAINFYIPYIGEINIYRYGIFYVIGFLAGYIFLKRLGKSGRITNKTIQNILNNKLEDLFIYIMIGVIVGGRLGHVIIYDIIYFFSNPLEIFAINKGGMSFIGGIVGVTISTILFKIQNKIKKNDFLELSDLIVVFVPFGIMLGRIGNFLNQELYGIIVNKDFLITKIGLLMQKLHIIHIYKNIDNLYRINTNLMSSVFEGLFLFIILMVIHNKKIKENSKIKHGTLTGIFIIIYSIIRFMLEFLRQDSQFEIIFGLSKSQWIFILFIIFGSIFLYKIQNNKNNKQIVV